MCQSIDCVLKFSETEGNVILSVSKSELMNKVIWMNDNLSADLRKKIQSDVEGLVYQKTKDKPHDPGSECFICNKCKVVIVFPLRAAR